MKQESKVVATSAIGYDKSVARLVEKRHLVDDCEPKLQEELIYGINRVIADIELGSGQRKTNVQKAPSPHQRGHASDYYAQLQDTKVTEMIGSMLNSPDGRQVGQVVRIGDIDRIVTELEINRNTTNSYLYYMLTEWTANLGHGFRAAQVAHWILEHGYKVK